MNTSDEKEEITSVYKNDIDKEDNVKMDTGESIDIYKVFSSHTKPRGQTVK